MKDFGEFRKTLRKSGWEKVRQRTHGIWRCPCGEHQLTVPLSPGDRRAVMNAITFARKLECPSLKDAL